MKNLLEAIAKDLGRSYLSDLHISNLGNIDFVSILSKIPQGQYSVQEWEKAVQYILEDYELSAKSEEEARNLLYSRTRKMY